MLLESFQCNHVPLQQEYAEYIKHKFSKSRRKVVMLDYFVEQLDKIIDGLQQIPDTFILSHSITVLLNVPDKVIPRHYQIF
jgi:hypothetical protein